MVNPWRDSLSRTNRNKRMTNVECRIPNDGIHFLIYLISSISGSSICRRWRNVVYRPRQQRIVSIVALSD